MAVVHKLNSGWTYSQLTELTQINCSGTRNWVFYLRESLLRVRLIWVQLKFDELPFWNVPQGSMIKAKGQPRQAYSCSDFSCILKFSTAETVSVLDTACSFSAVQSPDKPFCPVVKPFKTCCFQMRAPAVCEVRHATLRRWIWVMVQQHSGH